MPVPPEAVPATQAAVLFAVINSERPTVRGLAETTGLSTAQVHARLRQLRKLGLVSWTTGTAGTLHATVTITKPLRLDARPNSRP